MLKINFGCGSIQPEGWLNIDHDPEFNALLGIDNVQDLSADIIVAHAVVQQWEWHSFTEKLKVLYSKIKYGGVLRISLPDIERGFKAFQEKDIDWFPNGEEYLDERFCAWLTWYSTSCTLMTSSLLVSKLCQAGFDNYLVNEVSFGETNFKDKQDSTELDTRQNEFYFIEAGK